MLSEKCSFGIVIAVEEAKREGDDAEREKDAKDEAEYVEGKTLQPADGEYLLVEYHTVYGGEDEADLCCPLFAALDEGEWQYGESQKHVETCLVHEGEEMLGNVEWLHAAIGTQDEALAEDDAVGQQVEGNGEKGKIHLVVCY